MGVQSILVANSRGRRLVKYSGNSKGCIWDQVIPVGSATLADLTKEITMEMRSRYGNHERLPDYVYVMDPLCDITERVQKFFREFGPAVFETRMRNKSTDKLVADIQRNVGELVEEVESWGARAVFTTLMPVSFDLTNRKLIRAGVRSANYYDRQQQQFNEVCSLVNAHLCKVNYKSRVRTVTLTSAIKNKRPAYSRFRENFFHDGCHADDGAGAERIAKLFRSVMQKYNRRHRNKSVYSNSKYSKRHY